MFEIERLGHLSYKVNVSGPFQLEIRALAELYGVTDEVILSMMLLFAGNMAQTRILNKIKDD